MAEPRITYTPCPDATPEGELDVLSAIYRFILFESSASKEGSPATAPNDAMKGSNNDRASSNCT